MANPEDWAVDSNEALELTVLGPLASRPLTFHPTFTYPIFGDAETIYGYRGLSVQLSLAAWDFRGYLKVTWDKKIDNSSETGVENVEEIFREHLPEGVS
jgi:histone acetyltransferase 1